jgi:hypothetical protein
MGRKIEKAAVDTTQNQPRRQAQIDLIEIEK